MSNRNSYYLPEVGDPHKTPKTTRMWRKKPNTNRGNKFNAVSIARKIESLLDEGYDFEEACTLAREEPLRSVAPPGGTPHVIPSSSQQHYSKRLKLDSKQEDWDWYAARSEREAAYAPSRSASLHFSNRAHCAGKNYNNRSLYFPSSSSGTHNFFDKAQCSKQNYYKRYSKRVTSEDTLQSSSHPQFHSRQFNSGGEHEEDWDAYLPDRDLPTQSAPAHLSDRPNITASSNKRYKKKMFLKGGRTSTRDSPTPAEICGEDKEDIAMAIVPSNFPDDTLTEDQIRMVREGLVGKILHESGDVSPRFVRFNAGLGWARLICKDAPTADWLKRVINAIKVWEKPTLKAVRETELPQGQVFLGFFPGSLHDSFDTVLATIAKQNATVDTQSWRVIRRRNKGNANTLNIFVDRKSLRALKKLQLRLIYKYTTVCLRPKKVVGLFPESEHVKYRRRKMKIASTEPGTEKLVPKQKRKFLAGCSVGGGQTQTLVDPKEEDYCEPSSVWVTNPKFRGFKASKVVKREKSPQKPVKSEPSKEQQ